MAQRRKGEGRRRLVRESTLRCPCCTQAWLAIGVVRGDEYMCKSCGHRFPVGVTRRRERRPGGGGAEGFRER